MSSIQDIQNLLKRVPPFIISESKKQDILSKSNIYFDLRTFIMSKYGLDESGAESRFQDFYRERVPKASITYLIDAIVEYSQTEGFDKHEELASNTNSIKMSLGSLLNLYR
jgi:hypothetical protein